MTETVADDAMLIEMGLTEKEYLTALKRIERQTVRTSNKLEKSFKAANGNAARSFKAAEKSASSFANGGLRQTTMQLSQVAQQGAATGDYLQALAIQLPDLALGFGTAGVAIGALVGALAPMALDMLRAGDASEELEEAMDDLASAVKRVQAAQADLSMSPLDLRVEWGDLDKAMRRLQEVEARLATAEADRQIRAATQTVAKGLGIGPAFDFGVNPDDIREGRAAIERLRLEGAAVSRRKIGTTGAEGEAINAEIGRLLEQMNALTGIENGLADLGEILGVTEEQAREVAVRLAEIGQTTDKSLKADRMSELTAFMAQTSDKLEDAESQANRLIETLKAGARGLIEQVAAEQAASQDGADATTRAQARVRKEYAKTTAELEKLAQDREIAEAGLSRAMAEGADAAAAAYREAIATIDAKVSGLIGAEQSIKDMTGELDALMRGLDLVEFDGEEQVRQAIAQMRERLEEAEEGVETLNAADLKALESSFSGLLSFMDRFLARIGQAAEDLAKLEAPGAAEFEARYVRRAVSGAGSADEELVRAVVSVADRLGVAAKDLLTVMSYETGGTFSTSITNPTTGATGLIQFMPDNLERYGIDAQSSITEQVIAAGKYLEDAGIRAGDGLLRIAAAINAGSPDRIHASDAGNGGAPGTVLDKVQGQMEGHKARAAGLLAAYGGAVHEETEDIKARKDALKEDIATRREALRVRQSLAEAAQRATGDAELEAQLIGKSAEEQARLRTEYMLTQQAKRDGIGLNERLAGSEQTVAEQIRDTAAAVGEYVAQQERREAAVEAAAKQTQFYADVQQELKTGLIDAIMEAESFAETLETVSKMLERAAWQAALFGEGPLARLFGTAEMGGMFGLLGFSSGGYTGPGGKHDPAGVVHKGEVVWSQADIARAGGVARVEALRRGDGAPASGGAAPRGGKPALPGGAAASEAIAPRVGTPALSDGAAASGAVASRGATPAPSEDAAAERIRRIVPAATRRLLDMARGGAVRAEGASARHADPGPASEPAGIVHKGEVVWSPQDVARLGGERVVEAMRLGKPGFAGGGVVSGLGGAMLPVAAATQRVPLAAPGAPAPVVRMKTEIVTPPGGSAREERETLPDGTRLQRYIVSEAVGDALSTPSGKARRLFDARAPQSRTRR
ncbi:hypothetical protein [Salipiger abyssi]|uniref:hypothetical protein n=1 Tax=Salipiger abyssi TaxID=1250539 RepID=UPI00405A1853